MSNPASPDRTDTSPEPRHTAKPGDVIGMYCGRPIYARDNLRWGSRTGEWLDAND